MQQRGDLPLCLWQSRVLEKPPSFRFQKTGLLLASLRLPDREPPGKMRL